MRVKILLEKLRLYAHRVRAAHPATTELKDVTNVIFDSLNFAT